MQEEALCYLCPEVLTKDSDNVEIYGCSCRALLGGHRNCFKKWYQYVKCNNKEIVCCDCREKLVLKAKELTVHEDGVVCSLCLNSLQDECNIIQTYGCDCSMPRVYHNGCYESHSKRVRCPECRRQLDYKVKVSLVREGRQLSNEEIATKIQKNFDSNTRCMAIRVVGAFLLAGAPFFIVLLTSGAIPAK